MKLPFSRNAGTKAERSGAEAGEMSLVDHLSELRTRLIRCVAAVIIGAIVVYIFQTRLFDFLSQPYCDLNPTEECNFLVTSPLGEFNVALTLAGYGGLILALPVILYQLGRFIMPGLYPREKRLLLPFMVVSILLLLGGMTAAYFFMPRALDVLSNIGSQRFEQFFTPEEYLGFFVKMILAFGIAFELPLILVFLQLVGALQTETLRKNRRIGIVAVVILGAVVTPTGDPFTLAIISVPMYIFYEIAIIIGGRMTKKRQAALA